MSVAALDCGESHRQSSKFQRWDCDDFRHQDQLRQLDRPPKDVEPPRIDAVPIVKDSLFRIRVSEILALRWEHIDLKTGSMLVQQGVVNGRIGKVKTEASHDEIPLDPVFAQVLLNRRGTRERG